jgi:hypothetical protein
MKITYELKLPDEEFDYQLFQRAFDMYQALNEIDNLRRGFEKGEQTEKDVEHFIDCIGQTLCDSGIFNIDG